MLELFRAGDASLLSSSWENFPHTVVEALAVGTPVIATRTGGVAEVVRDGENGLVVEPGDVDALAGGDRALLRRRRARRAAARERRAVGRRRTRPSAIYGRLERILRRGAPDDARAFSSSAARATGCRSTESLARKWDALSERMDVRVLASGTGARPALPSDCRRATLDGPRFYASLPFEIARELRIVPPRRDRRREPVRGVAAELAAAGTRSPAKLVVEVHGDWHVATRLYGSRLRATLGPLGDRAAGWAVRRADAHRAVSEFTASLVRATGREPAGVFTTYSDLGAFTGPVVPVPDEPRVLFVGVLERYKNVEVLAAALAASSPRACPEARLHLVGMGTQTGVAEALAREGVALGSPPRAGGASRPRSTRRVRCCFPRPRRGCRALRSRRSSAAARSSARAPAASRTSSSTSVNGLLVAPGDATRARGRDRADRCASPASPSGSAPARTRRRAVGLDAGRVRRPRPRRRPERR